MKKLIAVIAAAVLLTALFATGCSKPGTGESTGSSPGGTDVKNGGEVNVYNWGEYIDESIFADFEKETGFRPPQTEFIDGVVYDGRKPNEYLDKFAIGLKGAEKI